MQPSSQVQKSLKSIKYDNGDEYFGSQLDDKPHGFGKMVYHNQDVYVGEFRYGLRHGKGTMRSLEGDVQQGEWCNGKMNGHFVLVGKDGLFYEGECLGGWACGYGVEHFHSGETYAGEFYGDKPEGYGVQRYADGSRYQGKWIEGKRWGFGILTLPTGAAYMGNWHNDLLHGKILLTYKTSRVSYEVEYQHGIRKQTRELSQYLPMRFYRLPSPTLFKSTFFAAIEDRNHASIQLAQLNNKRGRKRKPPSTIDSETLKKLQRTTKELRADYDKKKGQEVADCQKCFYCFEAFAGEKLHLKKRQEETQHTACADCASQLDDCPICREPLTETTRVDMRI